MKYPKQPPSTDPTLQIAAYRKALAGTDSAMTRSSTSGGMGKKDASAKATANRKGVA